MRAFTFSRAHSSSRFGPLTALVSQSDSQDHVIADPRHFKDITSRRSNANPKRTEESKRGSLPNWGNVQNVAIKTELGNQKLGKLLIGHKHIKDKIKHFGWIWGDHRSLLFPRDNPGLSSLPQITTTLLHSQERPSLGEELYARNSGRLKGHTMI